MWDSGEQPVPQKIEQPRDHAGAIPLAEYSKDTRMVKPTHSYLTPKCDVREAADRGGYTVMAIKPIQKGELIVVWSGTLVDGATLTDLPPPVKRHSLQVEEDHYLVSLTDSEPADYVNHSCTPNAGLSGQIALVAMRDIRPGEEVTYDYAMSDGSPYDEFTCRCETARCRGRVTGDDWKRPELWGYYQGYFSTYLQRRIAKLRRKFAAKSSTGVIARLPAQRRARSG